VLSGVFVSATEALAVIEPGVLHRSDDAGLSFRPVALPSGTALAVLLVGDVPRVYGTDGVWRWSQGALVPDASAPTAEALLNAAPMPHPEEGFPLPEAEDQAVARADGVVVTVSRDEVLERDPRSGRVLRRRPAPGSACQLFGGGPSLRMACTDGHWARVVFVERPDGSFAVARDERRGEALGDLVADPRSLAWVVSAPCEPHAPPDPRALCVHDAQERRSTRVAPFDVLPVALSGVSLLAVELASSGDHTRAVLWRGGRPTVLELPFDHESARALRWTPRGWTVCTRAPTDQLTCLRGVDHGPTLRWVSLETPPRSRHGAILADGSIVYSGQNAAELWHYVPGRGIMPLRGLVQGEASWLSLADAEGVYCVGMVCRLSPRVTWSAVGVDSTAVLTRTDPPWVGRARPRPSLPQLRCENVRATRAPPSWPWPLPGEWLERDGAFAEPRARVFDGAPGHRLALTVEARAGVSVATVVTANTLTGGVLDRAILALWAPPEAVNAAVVDGREGVMVQGDDGWLRFHPMAGAPVFPSTWPGLHPTTPSCHAGVPVRGVVYLTTGVHPFLSSAESAVEALSLVGDRTCVRGFWVRSSIPGPSTLQHVSEPRHAGGVRQEMVLTLENQGDALEGFHVGTHVTPQAVRCTAGS
jgi:hypothetical protein